MERQDMERIFDMLDFERKGFLTAEQLQDFHESLHFKSINSQHVLAAIQHVYKTSVMEKVNKEKFNDVLQEMTRRQVAEEKARWDFMALDSTASCRITAKDALLLFRATHGHKFSMKTWQRFLKSREDADADVSFDEIKMWLCQQPDDQPLSRTELADEETRLALHNTKSNKRDYESYMTKKMTAISTDIANQNYRENTKGLARRKQHRWDVEGVKGLLYDDGIYNGEELPKRSRGNVGMNDLLDALHLKYDLLRKLLFTEMLRRDMGDVMWSCLADEEQSEALHSLQQQVKQLHKQGLLSSPAAATLPGAQVAYEYSLQGLMGAVRNSLPQQLNSISEMRRKLRDEGKDEDQLEDQLKVLYETSCKARTESKDLVVDLESRFAEEKDAILGSVRTAASGTMSASQWLLLEHCRLTRQLALAKLEENFISTATVIGLAEKSSHHSSNQFMPELVHQERIASQWLEQRKGGKVSLPAEGIGKVKGQAEALVALVQEITWKHVLERQEMVSLLHNEQLTAIMRAAEQESMEERQQRRSVLRQQRLSWINSSTEYRATQTQENTALLLKALGLYLADKEDKLERLRGSNAVNKEVLAITALSELQQLQDAEFDEMLSFIPLKGEAELERLRIVELSARQGNLLHSVATLLLGAFDLSDEEQLFMKAVEEKYKALSNVLLYHALKAEHGLAWERLDEEEQQRKMVKKKKDMEQLLQGDSYLKDVSSVIGAIPEEFPSLRTLVGESKGEYKERNDKFFKRQEQEIRNGGDPDLLENDEVPAGSMKSINHLADLRNRLFTEQNDLLTLLRSEVKDKGHQLLLLALIKAEQKRVEKEEWYDLAAWSLGLRERVAAALGNRHGTDTWRQRELATIRLELYLMRVSAGKGFAKQLDEYARPAAEDSMAWMVSVLHEMDKKHVEEREILLSLLQDPSLAELMEPASQMTSDERHQRLAQLRTKAYNLNMHEQGQREENICILEEAAAIKSVMYRVSNAGQGHKEVTVHLLTALQDEQDREIATLIHKLQLMDGKEMKKAREYEINLRHWETGENVLRVLTQYQGNAEDDVLLKALDEKYDALRDQLLMQALMRQVGEREWQEMSEQERQKQLMLLRLQERKLRREGRHKDLAKLLGENQASEELLKRLMGVSRAENERKLQERLGHRQPRSQGPATEDDEEEEEAGLKDVLTSLTDRYQQDKDALLARLRGMNSEYLSEQQRQAELVRLRRERLLAQKADNFDSAALLIGLAEHHQVEAQQRIQQNRQRQEQLARERLEALRKKRGEKLNESDSVLKEGSKVSLMEAVMRRLDEKQAQERLVLAEMMDRCDSASRLVVRTMTWTDRSELLMSLKDKLAQSDPESDTIKAVLQDAANVKLESRHVTLTQRTPGTEVSDEEVKVSILADLQERQDQEVIKVMEDMQDKDNRELVELQSQYIEDKKTLLPENVTSVVLAAETDTMDTETQVLDALESKYDALRDKLFAEALMKQVGESEWQQLSEQERQQRMVQLKLQERRLRQEGHYDEAAALLGEALREHEALERLMGETKAEQEQRLRERLEKRQQRRQQGYTEEQCDDMEQQEKHSRNILLDLNKAYDKEREALLQQLRDSKDAEDAERMRQMMLALIKRDQRRAKREDRFDAAAILLGMVKQQELKHEADRGRQERLARERLEARRARRQAGVVDVTASLQDEVRLSEDASVLQMQEALITLLELKHQEEREVLMQVLESDETQESRLAAAEMGDEEKEAQLLMLKETRDFMKMEANFQNQNALLQEAAGVRIHLITRDLQTIGKPCLDEDLQVALLAQLQQQQSEEMALVMKDAENASTENLKQAVLSQKLSHQQQHNDNIAAVLLGSSPLKSDDEVLVEALDKKYDVLRDKLLTEALMKQTGEAEWAALSERERQRKLMKMKLEERRLRREGRYDEAVALLGQLLSQQDEYLKQLGESRSEQKQRLEERLKHRQELLAGRAAQGLATDVAVLDAIQDQEEAELQALSKKNILLELQHHYEDEKEALLATLERQTDRKAAERQRQLQLAQLRREQRQLKQEDKFDTAALLLHMAEEQGKTIEANYENERERQRELARERLAAQRLRLQRHSQDDPAALLEILPESSSTNGADIMEAITEDTDRKHHREIELLMRMIDEVQSNANIMNQFSSADQQDLEARLNELHMKCSRWRQQSVAEAEQLSGASEEERQAKSRSQLYGLLRTATAIRICWEKVRVKQEELGDEEAGVRMLADLQHKQHVELNFIQSVLNKQDEMDLKQLQQSQQAAVKEGWHENLVRSIFSLSASAAIVHDEQPEQQQKEEHLQQQLDLEFQVEQDQLLAKANAGLLGEDVDIDAEMQKLQQQQEAKKLALKKALERQRLQMQSKLEARRIAREAADYEQDLATEMMRRHLQQQHTQEDLDKQEKGRQNQLMQERIAARREARRRAADEDKDSSEGSSASSPIPPAMGLRREKTALDVEVSDDQKRELYSQLVREQQALHKKISTQQQRQQEKVEKRLAERKHRRQSEINALFSIGERQRTILEKSRKEERERQITAMKERVARVRYERTMTTKDKGSQAASTFDHLVDDGEASGLSVDDKMALAAQRMEQQLKTQAKNDHEAEVTTELAYRVAEMPQQPGKLRDEDRMRMLKEKQKDRKMRRQQQQGAADGTQ